MIAIVIAIVKYLWIECKRLENKRVAVAVNAFGIAMHDTMANTNGGPHEVVVIGQDDKVRRFRKQRNKLEQSPASSAHSSDNVRGTHLTGVPYAVVMRYASLTG